MSASAQLGGLARRVDGLDRVLLSRDAFFTLNTARSRARTVSELCACLLSPQDSASLREGFVLGLVATIEAMLGAFPHNLFWDLEALAAVQLREARRAVDPAAAIRHRWTRIADLQHLFGHRGPIRFRYIHDFIYGFDWARWVAKSPQTRANVGPYDGAFVERMHRRGAELVETIEAGEDVTYPPLRDGRVRNPFGFSREPDDELALHRRLVELDALPVHAWSPDAEPRWQRPYKQLRDDAAEALRITA